MSQKQQKIQSKRQVNQSEQPQIIQQKSSKTNGTVIRRFKKGPFLGKGGFARCYQIQNIENRKISAIKIVCKQTLKKAKAKQKLITQIKIHKSLSHKNIVSFDHVFQDTDNVYIVLQLCSNHTLNQMLKQRKRISQLQIQYYIYQIIQGLKYIHLNKVIHRDLKLGNLMINQMMEIKIGDFGLAAQLEFNSDKRKTICGTPNYLAPEIIDGKGHSYQVDIWSLGVIMYALLYGRPPFETNDVKKTYKRIKQCQYTFNDQINVSHNAKNLISRILIVDPSKRLTLDQILCHPFMNSNKIPKTLPVSSLTTPLPKTFIEQYMYYSGNLGSSKFNNSMKQLQKVQSQYQKMKNSKGISQRFLMRTSSAAHRNLINKKQQLQSQTLQKQQQPATTTLSNNFFYKPQTPKLKQRIYPQQQQYQKHNKIFVKKWVDYSSKYGLGYLLSDGSTGIYFNDSTKMCLDNKGQKVDYVTNQTQDGKILVSFSISQGSTDREIIKKITLMQYFKKYLNGGNTNENTQTNKINDNKQNKQNTPPFLYIKKWIKTDQGILFRLNNKVIQINFNDKSQIMIYGQSNTIAYCGKNNNPSERVFISMNNLAEIKNNHDFSIKMEFVKVMLKRINSKQPTLEQSINLPMNIQKETIKAF